MTAPIKHDPCAQDFTATIARLREIASVSTTSLLTEGPVNPDHQLLELCAVALHRLVHAERARQARQSLNWISKEGTEREREHAEDKRLLAELLEGEEAAKPPLARIRKLKAQTPAGIYAKAAVVRASKAGAATVAMSLAEDLLACAPLRALLWQGLGRVDDGAASLG